MKTTFLLVALTCLTALAPHAAAQSGGQPGATAGPAMSAQELDKLLAPIALYPDALVAQILQCSTSPFQVRAVAEWMKAHPDLKGTAAQDAASKEGFDPSFVALVLFPDVVKMLNDQPDWTKKLGQAFQTDRDGLFASVQRLRAEAEKLGNLKSNQQQQVETVTTQAGQQVIVVQPANPQVVYVPQYNPQVVYTQPAPTYDSGQTTAAALVGFTAGVIVGAALDNDDHNYYYGYGGWGYRGPVMCSDCWNDYYDHRRDMANDYYNHRQNMANNYYDYRDNMAQQRGENQSNRQDAWSQNRSDRQDTWQQGQSNRQDSRSQAQTNRQDAWSQGQSDRSANQSARQDSRSQAQSSFQSRSGGFSQSGYQGPQSRAGGGQSGAFSGYQSGGMERASSQRGYSSLSSSRGSWGQRGGGSWGGRGGGRGRR